MTISIQQLHEETSKWIRAAEQHGEVKVSEGGRVIARIMPSPPSVKTPDVPYFARRKVSPEFAAIMETLSGGTDSTILISQDRDESER